MTAGAAEPATVAGYPVIASAWDLYRASQQLPFSGDLFTAQSRLFLLLEPHTRTCGNGWPGAPDPDGITGAAGKLADVMQRGSGERRAA